METKEINLIFQFLEEIYENDKSNSSIKEIEKKLLICYNKNKKLRWYFVL